MELFESSASADLPADSWRENVAAVVVDAGGRVLLGLGTGHNAYWHFPQGGIAGKETYEQALHRELWEEVRLAPAQYRILASYGGLRYRYRKHNDKSGRWRGQEQTYMLVLCHEEMPATDCSHTDEFCALTWVPWRELGLDLFAPVKRKVVDKVLAAFFSPGAGADWLPWLCQRMTPARYRLSNRLLADCPVDDRTLYGGGKEEMTNTLARLGLRLRAEHSRMTASGGRLLVLLHGSAGSARRQFLRRLAAHLNPLHTRGAEAEIFEPGLPWELLASLPPAGGVSLILHRAAGGDAPQHWPACENWLIAQGIRVLKLYLHAAENEGAGALLADSDTAASPWYVIPSGRHWYRDYVVAQLVASALGSPL